jgi:nifR3 family TIM-barrel protein
VRTTTTIGRIALSPPFGLAPLAGLTDTAFRRLVKRNGGCALVVTEMINAEGLVRGQDRTLEYAEFTEEERPVATQIFGGDPERMAEAARLVESIGADIVDVNMGCPVPKIARGNAGCLLMREPGRAAAIVSAMARAVRIPVTVKMRTGWDDNGIVAPDFAKKMEDAGAAAVTVHGRTGVQAYRGSSDWDVIARVARSVTIPVFGNGDCIEPGQVVGRWRESGVAGVLVGRGVVRNPWLLAQAGELADGRPARPVTAEDRARFLLEYIDLLVGGTAAGPEGARRGAWPAAHLRGAGNVRRRTTRSRATATPGDHERWVVGKVRGLAAWYTRGLESGSRFRVAVNQAGSVGQIRDTVQLFFAGSSDPGPAGRSTPDANLRV